MPLSEEQREFVRICAASGWTAREVANEIGVTRNMVLGHAARNGIQFKHRFNHKLRDEELPPVVEPIPDLKPAPEPLPDVPSGALCIAEGCTRTRMRQTLHGLCHEHDQQRIKGKAA